MAASGRTFRLLVAAALALALLVAGCRQDSRTSPDEDTGPAPRPVPSGRAVLADPRVTLHMDDWALDDVGSVLAVALVPDGGSTEGCDSTAPAALVWNGADGGRRVLSGDVLSRIIEPVPGGGFVVGAVLPECVRATAGPGAGSDPGPYLIDRSGRTLHVTWLPQGTAGRRAEAVCGDRPDDPRCVFSVEKGTGRLTGSAPLRYPRGAMHVAQRDGDRLWTRSIDSARLWWSDDGGRTWDSHAASLKPAPGAAVLVAGSWFAFLRGHRAEYSADAGRTWRIRDLAGPAKRLPPGYRLWSLTAGGTLLVGTASSRFGNHLYRSTDSSWTRFAATPVATRLTIVQVETRHHATYVVDRNRWWVSQDDGRTWRTVHPLR